MGREQRRHARELSIQVLYAYFITEDPIDQVMTNVLGFNENPDYDKEHLRNLVLRTVANVEAIDARIVEGAKNWKFNRIAMIDKIILRQSIAEYVYIDDVPPKVTMAEAIELAKDFSTRESHTFINGILDKIYHDLIREGRIMPDLYKKKKEKKEDDKS